MAVASRRDGVEEQRGRLGGGVADIGLHVQQRGDVNFHGEARQVPIPTAGEQGSRRAETNQRDLRPFPLIPPLSPPRESPGLCSLQAPPLPSPLLSARLLGPSPPILLQTLALNCICHRP